MQSDPLWSEPGSYSSPKTEDGKAFGFEAADRSSSETASPRFLAPQAEQGAFVVSHDDPRFPSRR